MLLVKALLDYRDYYLHSVLFFPLLFFKAGECIHKRIIIESSVSFTVCLNKFLLVLEGQRENDPFLFSVFFLSVQFPLQLYNIPTKII